MVGERRLDAEVHKRRTGAADQQPFWRHAANRKAPDQRALAGADFGADGNISQRLGKNRFGLQDGLVFADDHKRIMGEPDGVEVQVRDFRERVPLDRGSGRELSGRAPRHGAWACRSP